MFLGKNFNYQSKFLSIAVKCVVQQMVFAPLFASYFFSMHALLSGDNVWERVKKAVPESWINSAKLWPAVTAFTFTFIRPQYRFMTSGVVAVFWQGYLSW